MAYADAIPMDLLKAEQHRISRERDEAEREVAEARNTGEGIMETYRRAQALMQRGAEAYRLRGPDVRRLLAQAFLARIEVDTDDERATLANPWREIREAASRARPLAREGRTHVRRSTTNEPRPFRWPGFELEPFGGPKGTIIEPRGRRGAHARPAGSGWTQGQRQREFKRSSSCDSSLAGG